MAEFTWFKSSYSTNEDAACVEIAWHKSSYSSNEGPAECVEVAEITAAVLVRDSKDKGGPHLTFSPDGWQAFVAFAATAEV
ncbi:DUF397 domain-containing protein [Kitasatospora sp. NPDC093806]|uniref:DUF397 domain-containing protein n=1 Tax=Kitasatospora sp. NPDC093806 TaxID=3155075 RepID=UPI00343C7315